MTILAKGVTQLIAEMAEGEPKSLTLGALRDTLPKLISGDLRACGLKKTTQAMANVKWASMRGCSRES